MINDTVVSNGGSLSDDHPHTMVYEKPSADFRSRMDFYPGGESCGLTDQSCQKKQFLSITEMSHPVSKEGVYCRVQEEDLQIGFCRFIIF